MTVIFDAVEQVIQDERITSAMTVRYICVKGNRNQPHPGFPVERHFQ